MGNVFLFVLSCVLNNIEVFKYFELIFALYLGISQCNAESKKFQGIIASSYVLQMYSSLCNSELMSCFEIIGCCHLVVCIRPWRFYSKIVIFIFDFDTVLFILQFYTFAGHEIFLPNFALSSDVLNIIQQGCEKFKDHLKTPLQPRVYQTFWLIP